MSLLTRLFGSKNDKKDYGSERVKKSDPFPEDRLHDEELIGIFSDYILLFRLGELINILEKRSHRFPRRTMNGKKLDPARLIDIVDSNASYFNITPNIHDAVVEINAIVTEWKQLKSIAEKFEYVYKYDPNVGLIEDLLKADCIRNIYISVFGDSIAWCIKEIDIIVRNNDRGLLLDPTATSNSFDNILPFFDILTIVLIYFSEIYGMVAPRDDSVKQSIPSLSIYSFEIISATSDVTGQLADKIKELQKLA